MERLVLRAANLIGCVLLLLALWPAPARLTGDRDVVAIYCGIVLLLDAICVAPLPQ